VDVDVDAAGIASTVGGIAGVVADGRRTSAFNILHTILEHGHLRVQFFYRGTRLLATGLWMWLGMLDVGSGLRRQF